MGEFAGQQQGLVRGQQVDRLGPYARPQPGRPYPPAQDQPPRPGVPGQRIDESAPTPVPPGPVGSQQRVDAVEDQQHPLPLKPRSDGAGEVLRRPVGPARVQQTQAVQPGHRPFQGQGEGGEGFLRAVVVVPFLFLGCGEPDDPLEGVGMRGGQLLCAGGLSGPRHALQQHPAESAARGQGGTGAREEGDTADEVVGWGWELGGLLLAGDVCAAQRLIQRLA
ncbi:hypothetical protein T45_02109 [Streptomyces turgidiscabies]|nr:hypothetical protein T45_02109 [Streptomyces turgidiscabies]